jgi:hypothetical protein
MKPRLVNAAADRLAMPAAGAPSEEPVTQDEVLRVLARIARTGRAGDRLRAAELIGKQLGMFRQQEGDRGPTLEEMILEADRMSRERSGQPADGDVGDGKPQAGSS